MSSGRKVLLVIGIVLALPALLLLALGALVGGVYAFGRDDDGWFSADLEPVRTPAAAIITSDLDFGGDPGPSTVLDRLDVKFRITAHAHTPSRRLFVGIARTRDVRTFLRGVRVARVSDVEHGDRLELTTRSGRVTARPPGAEDIWVVSSTGPAPRVRWEPDEGNWTVVVMNASGAAGVGTQIDAAVKADFLAPLAFVLGGIGLLLAVVAIVLIVVAASGRRAPPDGGPPAAPAVAADQLFGPEPVAVVGELDPALSRWQWLVKWFLAIPHYVVLFFLWAAYLLLTIVAGFAILFTGRYPRSIFDFNVGVMRWTWRVHFYATQGGIGTDRYPPFTLADVPDYPARLDVAYPERLSRGLVLVKWWLLAIPQYLVVGAVTGGYGDGTRRVSLLVVLVVVAGVVLLFRGAYPRPLFDLIVGINRWGVRVAAYATLMTDRYPPFRLDQGPREPGVGAPEPEPGSPPAARI